MRLSPSCLHLMCALVCPTRHQTQFHTRFSKQLALKPVSHVRTPVQTHHHASLALPARLLPLMPLPRPSMPFLTPMPPPHRCLTVIRPAAYSPPPPPLPLPPPRSPRPFCHHHRRSARLHCQFFTSPIQNTNTRFKRQMSITFTTLDSHTSTTL